MSDEENTGEETAVVEQSWFARLWKSIKGFGLGFLMFVGSFYLLGWNEGRALQTYQSLDEGLGAVVSIDSSTLHDNNNEKLVHMSGTATSDEELVDETFSISVNALQLFRHVEMFQWQQTIREKTKKNVSGETTKRKVPVYDRIWSAELIDSKDFIKDDKDNPAKFPISRHAKTAKNIQLGAFIIPVDMISGIENSAAISLSESNIPRDLIDRAVLHDDYLFVGNDLRRPEIGDLRIRFSQTPATEVTVVARQDGNTFAEYQTQAGDSLSMLKKGKLSAHDMFAEAKSQNSIMIWILRAVGIAAMCGGLKMMLLPLVVVTDFIPFVSGIMALGVSVVCGVVGVSLSLLTIGMAWISYRPSVGIPLLAVSVVGLFVLIKKRRRRSTVDVGEDAEASPPTLAAETSSQAETV
jgi:hypothetical protein